MKQKDKWHGIYQNTKIFIETKNFCLKENLIINCLEQCNKIKEKEKMLKVSEKGAMAEKN